MWWYDHWWVVLAAILAFPMAFVALFAWWLRRHPNMNVENGVKCWEVFVKLVSAFTVIVTGAFLFGRYIDQQDGLHKQAQLHERRELNLQKATFLRQKLQFDTDRQQRKRSLFSEASTLAAQLANRGANDRQARNRFDELYYAALIGLEEANGPVERAMIEFRNKLENESSSPEISFGQLSLRLSTACNVELEKSEAALFAQHEAIAKLITD